MIRPSILLALCTTPLLGQSAPDSCATLAQLHLDHATVTSAAIVTGQCRVQITATPTPDSDIRIHLWLPATSTWNGRFLAYGNGGFAGEFHPELMAASVTQGYATASTDTGHPNTTGDFAFGHPEKVIDFGWRGIHEMTVQSKAVIAAFYAKPTAHNYFAGCSDGGREALMEAQRFPADYDGILAGAPAYNWSSLVSGSGLVVQRQNTNPAASISSSKLPAIAAAVNRACDAQDGITDGILNDPRTCHFAPATLTCKGPETDACLTPPQVETLTLFYTPRLADDGHKILAAYSPGAAAAPGGPAQWLFGPAPGAPTAMLFFTTGYFSNFVYQDPAWKLSSFSLDRDWHAAQQRTAAALDATSPDLHSFLARGGKLILYHGWNDPAIPALSTVDYYDQLTATLGAKAVTDATRLYMVPGMLHCGGGPGATEFGASGRTRTDAQHDILTALEHWVEAGTAPETLIATRPGATPTLTRPLCPYPAVSKYTGTNPNTAASFTCTTP